MQQKVQNTVQKESNQLQHAALNSAQQVQQHAQHSEHWQIHNPVKSKYGHSKAIEACKIGKYLIFEWKVFLERVQIAEESSTTHQYPKHGHTQVPHFFISCLRVFILRAHFSSACRWSALAWAIFSVRDTTVWSCSAATSSSSCSRASCRRTIHSTNEKKTMDTESEQEQLGLFSILLCYQGLPCTSMWVQSSWRINLHTTTD